MARTLRTSVVLAAALTVVAAVPLMTPVASAAATTRTVIAVQVAHTTTSPRCTFGFQIGETITGPDVTSLHLRGEWSCDSSVAAPIAVLNLWDNLDPATNTVNGYRVTNNETQTAAVLTPDYTQPKTNHAYIAGFDFFGVLPPGMTASPD